MAKNDTQRDSGTLDESNITADRSVDRRSAIRAIGAVLAGAAAATVLAIPGEADAQCTESDAGRWGDAPGHGRRCR